MDKDNALFVCDRLPPCAGNAPPLTLHGSRRRLDTAIRMHLGLRGFMCTATAPVPQGGAIKLYKGLACPLDGYEIILFSLSGADGKTYPLCPFCYNHPPFEGVLKVGMAAPCVY